MNDKILFLAKVEVATTIAIEVALLPEVLDIANGT